MTESMNEKIQESLAFIEQHIYKSISLDEMATHVFLSTRSFYRLFKKYTGESPAKYLEKKKMEKALELLRMPGSGINTIAYTLGYKNYETFSTRFKRYYKISPGDLKNILDSISDQRSETRIDFDYMLIPLAWQNVSEKMEQLEEKFAGKNEKMEAFIVHKNQQANISRKKNKYHISKYVAGK
jgi:AraC-like DNA-binding protein